MSEADVKHHYYDVRTGMTVDCLPLTRGAWIARCWDGFIVTASTEEALRAAMADHQTWLTVGCHDE